MFCSQILICISNYVRSDYSKGKKVRDKEGNPIPLDQQSPGPLGKGANAGSENIGDPGDLGGPNFKSPKTFFGKIVVFLASAATIYQNMNDSKPIPVPVVENDNELDKTISINKGK